jgi:uncharacterized hydrophobic protein (TIGR00271 family)
MPVLRISCPSARTASIVAILRDAAMAADVVVVPRSPDHDGGDLVLAEVERSGVDPFLVVVKELHGTADVRVTMQDAEQLLPAPEIGPLVDDQVVWAKVNQDIRESSRPSIVNLLLISLAAIIAAVGIIEDQLLYIVGAMAISPDYLLISEVNIAIVRRDIGRVRTGLLSVAAAFAMAACGAFLFTAMLRSVDLLAKNSVVERQFTRFITNPDGLTVFVAVAAGIAGALALTLPDARGLVGVFVSITTIPAAANIGVAAEEGNWGDVGSAAIQIGVNILCLIIAGSATLEIRRHVANRFRIRPRVERTYELLDE